MITVCYGSCQFPAFLCPLKSTEPCIWLTETRYKQNSSVVESQLELTVKGDELIAKLMFQSFCRDDSSHTTCHHREFVYQRRCLTHSMGRYLVEHNDGV